KGLLHPEDRLIAYLRYAPDSDGDRTTTDGRHYRKIYSLKEREEYLRKIKMNYLWFDRTLDRNVQSVPNTAVAFIQDPIDALRQFRDMGGHISPLQDSTVKLAQILVERSKISWSDIGVTGSQLVNLATNKSDIDLVIYGDDAGRKVFSMLNQEFDSIPELVRYSDKILDTHVSFRWGSKNTRLKELREIERGKILQGIINDYEFFIRLVKRPEDLNFSYGDVSFRDDGITTAVCKVTSSSDKMFTPCSYEVECDSIPNLRKIVSFRGRFTEHALEGMDVEVKGRLESVSFVDGAKYRRFVLGEDPDDYMLPINR
ncbi:MAG: nucleotidyltransferase domain-containing protein, partial [Candidatus Thorarchaeota archaeon]